MGKFYVYVVDLNPKVLSISKFRSRNPDYVEGKPCVYVGSTAKSPEERYAQHKSGGRLANKYAYKFGRRLRPRNYDKFNPLPTRESAESKEEWLAINLQKRGYAVWWG